MPVSQKRAATYWLLPHERWLGRFAGRAGEPPPGGKAWAVQQNYGREGQVLILAVTADTIAAVVLMFAGVILLSASGASGSVAAAGYGLLGAAMLSGLIAVIRALQGSHAGRVYRAGRPFVRPGRR